MMSTPDFSQQGTCTPVLLLALLTTSLEMQGLGLRGLRECQDLPLNRLLQRFLVLQVTFSSLSDRTHAQIERTYTTTAQDLPP